MPWDIVRNEIINEKGLSSETAEQIWKYVQMNSSQINDLTERLRTDEKLSTQKLAIEALDQLDRLFHFLKLFQIHDKVCDCHL